MCWTGDPIDYTDTTPAATLAAQEQMINQLVSMSAHSATQLPGEMPIVAQVNPLLTQAGETLSKSLGYSGTNVTPAYRTMGNSTVGAWPGIINTDNDPGNGVDDSVQDTPVPPPMDMAVYKDTADTPATNPILQAYKDAQAKSSGSMVPGITSTISTGSAGSALNPAVLAQGAAQKTTIPSWLLNYMGSKTNKNTGSSFPS
jgi:hypothetical protein